VKLSLTLYLDGLDDLSHLMKVLQDDTPITVDCETVDKPVDKPIEEPIEEPVEETTTSTNPSNIWSSTAKDWTDFPLPANAKQIFVSESEGYDSNSGLSDNEPLKTLELGIDLLSDGKGDQLLLKRGDTFLNEDLGKWSKSGAGPNEMLLIGAYGEGTRPIVRPDKGKNIISHNGEEICNYVAITDLHFMSPELHNGVEKPPQLVWRAQTEGLHIEGCYFDGCAVIIQRVDRSGPIKNVVFRRNVVDTPYAVGGRIHIYWKQVNGGMFEENFLYHLGWKEGLVADDKFTHNFYGSHDCTNITFRRNISMLASSHGVQLRGGGIMDENLFIGNALQSFGYVLGGEKDAPLRNLGTCGSIRNNLFLDPKKIDGEDRGTGIQVGNINNIGLEISGNLFLNDTRSGELNSCAIELDPSNGPAGLNNLSIFGNIIYNWRGGLVIQADSNYSKVSRVDISGNAWQNMMGSGSRPLFVSILGSNYGKFSFAGNTFHRKEGETEVGFRVGDRTRYADRDFSWWTHNIESTAKEEELHYPDPTRTLSSYAVSVGGSNSSLAFVNRCRLQRKGFWSDDYTAKGVLNYFRTGFGMETLI